MKKNEQILPIAIQGFAGSFHQQAAVHFFGKKVSVHCCASFRELIKSTLDASKTSAAVMAIENSIAGSILPNYKLLEQSGLVVIGEIYLQINQHLLTNMGTGIDAIKEVHSHPMALQQCIQFLDEHKWKLVETDDTGLSAKLLAQHRSKHIAVIAGKMAAELFGLQILKSNIHDVKNNYTRFLVLLRKPDAVEIDDANKASISFRTNHKQGSLVKALAVVANHGINLSKLQSSPIPETEWLYSFHADMEFNSREQFLLMINDLKKVTKQIKILGIYKKGKTYKN